MKKWRLTIVFLSISLLISACLGSTEVTGKPDQGASLFYASQIGDAPGCATCHSITPGEIIVGPSLADIASRASSPIPGLATEEYIRQSILEPNAYIAEGFSPNVMYAKFSETLTQEQVQDLIAYLMALPE